MPVTDTVSTKPLGTHTEQKLSRGALILLGACVLLFLLLRVRWIGHLLVWDEAMTLCTVRSFKAGANDAFAGWFWRHPPIYSVFMLLLQPFNSGFAERAELLSIGFGVASQLLVFQLNRRIFGVVAALWSAFFLAVLPGSTFFDVWIKQDHPVATFGLLAMLLLLSRRTLYAGISLGLALLSKETAIYYALAIFLLWLGGACGRRSIKDFLAITVTPALTAGWWYFIVVPKAGITGSGGGRGILEHFQFAVQKTNVWSDSWHYYFTKLPAELGWMVLPICVLGACVAIRWFTRPSSTLAAASDTPRVWLAWPVLLVVPALMLLSLLPSKVPWVVISLFPAWATLAALPLAAVLSLVNPGKRSKGPQAQSERAGLSYETGAAGWAITIAVVLATGIFAGTRHYEPLLREIAESQWRGAAFSRESAAALNRLAADGDRALITSFYYWKGVPTGHPDPIFACYLTKKIDVLVRNHERPYEEVMADIKQYRLDWALLSPEPGPGASDLFGKIQAELGLEPHKLSGAWLYNTKSVYRSATNGPASSK
jgi:hypothetical protein